MSVPSSNPPGYPGGQPYGSPFPAGFGYPAVQNYPGQFYPGRHVTYQYYDRHGRGIAAFDVVAAGPHHVRLTGTPMPGD